jgi:CHASE2 domain
MIDGRQLIQAFLYDMVHLTMPEKPALKPPILLVKVDDNSLNAKGVIDKDPLDRGYMASLVQQASHLKTPIIGIDYVFKDNNRPRQIELSQALAEAHKHSRVVLGASRAWGTAYEKIIDPKIRVDGDIDVNVASNLKYEYPVFFARTIGDLQNPRIQSIPLPQQILCQWKASNHKDCRLNPTNAYYHTITAISAWFGQQWLNPWINYAIPTEQAYETISSQNFLGLSGPISQVILIVPSEEFDKFKMPAVLNYHIDQEQMAGGEIHAYQLYNLLTHTLITPIPDLWMIGLAGIIGKLLLHWLQNLPTDRSMSRRGWLVLTIILPIFAYGLSFWTYSMVSIVVPVLFPTLTYFGYLIAHGWQKKSRGSSRLRVL